MSDTILVIADKNYSLWPLAPWLCLKASNMPFKEKLIRFGQSNTRAQMLEYSPTGRVPAFHHNGLEIWDSLAICEYISELNPLAKLWPSNRNARAVARAFSCEMHGTGGAYPGAPRHIIYSLDTNIRRRTERVCLSKATQESVDYLVLHWRRLREAFGGEGPFLFGHFTIADAMSAHLVNRFVTYNVKLPKDIQEYCEAIRSYPPLVDWINQAELEEWKLASAEINISKV
jgi:glutathione S-transferase